MPVTSRSDIRRSPGSQSLEQSHLSRAPQRLAVLKVQRTCVHDGPGIRTTIFFRGCNLRCAWCQNPEALSSALDPVNDTTYAVDELVELVSRDKQYYLETGGGVTLSGGDPLLQDPSSLIPLLEALKKAGIHVAAETSLHVPQEHLTLLAPHIDLFLVDLKVVGDDELHKACTRQSAGLIHRNIHHLLDLKANLRFRMVMVPGFNDSPANIQATADFLKSVGHSSIELLKYHSFYEEKAKRLGLERPVLQITAEQASSSVRDATKAFAGWGILAVCHDMNSARHTAVFSDRVYAIQNAIRNSPYHLCLEVASLKTRYYKENGLDKPTPIHRAERLAYVLRNKAVIIYPRELLVGNFTSKRKGGQPWEEHSGALLGLVMHRIDKAAPVPFQVSRKERLDFYANIMPFWLKHGLTTKACASASDLVRRIAQISELSAGFNNNLSSIAHFVVNYERLLAHGTTGLIAEIDQARKSKPQENQPFYDGAVIALRALETFAERYADALAALARSESDPVRRAELEAMTQVCRHVPKHPARTYHEALQSMLFLQVALCMESYENAVSPGRLDQILYPYFKKDEEAGLIDYDRARELLALFVLKLDEAILVNDSNSFLRINRLFETMSTDQTITAGGLDKDGNDATNPLTYALLDICELQPYSANMTARIHPNSPAKYLERLAEVYINGAPMPALYNDEIYLETLQRHYDTTLEQARNYAVIGCVEPNASDDHYGNTDCANMNVALPFLQALRGDQSDLWNYGVSDQAEKVATKAVASYLGGSGRLSKGVFAAYTKSRDFYKQRRTAKLDPPKSMEELLQRFQMRLNCLATAILTDHQKIEAAIRKDFTTPLTSTLFKGCIDKGIDVNEGGATHNSSGIQAVGVTDVADSLHAIQEVVFKQGLYSLEDVISAMDHDFVGEPHARIQQALLAVPKFGQDDSAAAVEWVNRTLDVYVRALKQVPNCPRGGIYSAGYYALNVSNMYGKKTPALPSGRQAGIPLANSITPHYGMKVADLLSALNSVAAVDFAKYAPNGTTVTFTIDSALFQGPDGVRNLASVFKTFFDKGGMQFQPNVINRQILLDAYDHPEKYPNLLVRIAGYCAYFNQLSDDLKKSIINRTCYS